MDAAIHVITLAVLSALAYWFRLLQTGTEAAVKTTAEEAAKAVVRDLQWPAELARDLQKTRGVERQELRFKGYGALWAKLRPLAIYDVTVIDKNAVTGLSSSLSDWYFSDSGGLLLTPQSREFYFALQDLLRVTSTSQGGWMARRTDITEEGRKKAFGEVLSAVGASDASIVLNYFTGGAFGDWEVQAGELGRRWRGEVNKIAAGWSGLDEEQKFATFQQVGSILRSSLVNDLDSRLR